MSTGYYNVDLTEKIQTTNGVFESGRRHLRSWNGSNSPRNPDGSLQLRDNPYTMSDTASGTELIKYRWSYETGPYNKFNSSRNFMPTPIFRWTSNDDLALFSKLATKIRGSDYNIAIIAREGKESLNLIRNRASQLDKSLTAVSKKKFRKAARILGIPTPKSVGKAKDLSSAWLEFQFGWKPLVSDIVSSAQFLAELTNNQPAVTYKAAHSVPPDWQDSDYSILKSDNRKALRIASIRAIFDSPVPKWVHQGIVAPEEVVWESIPWSFLVDYLAPVGEYLSTVGLFSRIGLLGQYWRTDFTKVYIGPPWRQGTRSDRRIENVMSLVGWHKMVTVNRRQVSRPMVPTPQFKPLMEILDWKRALNVVALLIGSKARILHNEKRYYNRG